jgi:dTDP-4-dehydrorhamnose 3,5-epimerase
MDFRKLSIDGLVVIEPQVFEDERGFFMETYQKEKFAENGIEVDFVQDNHSFSVTNILRGMHYQLPPFAQDKLVRVVQGEVFDVAVDLRVDSETFGEWEGVKLSAENKRQFFIPKGFAHGFLVLSDSAHFVYKVTNFYNKESTGGVVWNDQEIGIEWPADEPVLNERDQDLPKLSDLKLPNNWD